MQQGQNEKRARPFDCATCPVKVQKIRRCHEDRWDFDEEDASHFPMQVEKGGMTYGFCPAKSTWDHETKNVFNLLMLTAETGVMYRSGGLTDQPEWYLDLLEFFIPLYDKIKFTSKARMILGDPKSTKSKVHKPSRSR